MCRDRDVLRMEGAGVSDTDSLRLPLSQDSCALVAVPSVPGTHNCEVMASSLLI